LKAVHIYTWGLAIRRMRKSEQARNFDDLEDDTADPNQVLSFVGAAQAPPGYKILESCPSLETHEDMQNLIGKQILHA
jgi:hypothetical protein